MRLVWPPGRPHRCAPRRRQVPSALRGAAWAAALAAASLLAAAGESAPDYDVSVLEVFVACQAPDPRIPWRRQPPASRQGYGVVIAPGRLLTCADLVRHPTQIELRRARSGAKLAAVVLQADAQLNAALLAFSNAPGDTALAPLCFDDSIRLGDRLTLVKLEPSGEFQSAEGRVVEISASGAPRPLALKVLTASTPSGQGAPALRDGRLAGLSVAYDAASQIGLFIPSATLRRFLEDAASPPYRGLAWAGFQFEPLLDPALRRFLGAPASAGGVLITAVTPGSGAAGVLQAGDVLTRWDGVPLDARGYYDDPGYGRLLFTYRLGRARSPGDRVPAVCIREGRALTVEVALGRHCERNDWIPEGREDEPPAYLVEGGLVLRELTGAYLRAAGAGWMLEANPRLLHYYTQASRFGGPPGERVVLLSFVLPDAVNVGYQELRDQVVTAANGRPVANLDDVLRIVDADGGLSRLSLKGYGVDLALDPAALPEANRRIAATYRLPSLRRRAAPGG